MMRPKLDTIPPDVACVDDFEPLARERLEAGAFAYLAGGAGHGVTVLANRLAFDAIDLVPRVLRPLSGGSTTCELLGLALPHPILMAPVAYLPLFHPEGERGAARAADATDTLMVLSTLSCATIEDVAAATPAPKWFQLYVQPDRGVTRELVARAEAAGYRAIVLTADAPLSGVRDAERRAGFRLPPGLAPANLRLAPPAQGTGHPIFDDILGTAATWDDVAAVVAATRLPVLVKGILSHADAALAVSAGASGIVVSNHGGRTLDTSVPALRALSRVVRVVDGRVPVLVDGGIRRGTDVLKAIALGATAVLCGRAWAQAFAAAGPLGAAWALKVLVEEFTVAMALTGCRRLADIGPDLLEGEERR